jgi:hypothetical protein
LILAPWKITSASTPSRKKTDRGRLRLAQHETHLRIRIPIRESARRSGAPDCACCWWALCCDLAIMQCRFVVSSTGQTIRIRRNFPILLKFYPVYGKRLLFRSGLVRCSTKCIKMFRMQVRNFAESGWRRFHSRIFWISPGSPSGACGCAGNRTALPEFEPIAQPVG